MDMEESETNDFKQHQYNEQDVLELIAMNSFSFHHCGIANMMTVQSMQKLRTCTSWDESEIAQRCNMYSYVNACNISLFGKPWNGWGLIWGRRVIDYKLADRQTKIDCDKYDTTKVH